ncbi:MAG: LysM peptidoglycan-binding domain-containing protein [Robiginitomaculum sp.]|nr:LysM peptidoglycan-binding domain-containing protein [Robiginitomaculum sp.]
MLKTFIVSGSMLSILATLPAMAQTTTIVNEAIPSQRQIIIANSAEDIALQEEIRKIRAYNAYVDAQVGVSGIEEVIEPAPQKLPSKIELFVNAPAEIPTENRLLITYQNAGKIPTLIVPVVTLVDRQDLNNDAGIHVIAEGDTLYQFSRKRCISVADIQNLNNLTDANIRLGQKLSLPASQCELIATSSIVKQKDYVRVVMPVPSSVEITRNYAVLPSDSLYSIGRQYCVSAEEMAAHNGIALTKAIHPGQILELPASACVK